MNASLERVLADYSDQSKTCWASDSNMNVAECWCAQCQEARVLLPIAIETKAKLESKDNVIASYLDLKNKVRNYIQASIDREEWSADELAEPFWEELAELVDLNLRRTKEIWISVTVKYSGRVEVPYDFDEDDLDYEDVPSIITISYRGDDLEEQSVTYDGTETYIE